MAISAYTDQSSSPCKINGEYYQVRGNEWLAGYQRRFKKSEHSLNLFCKSFRNLLCQTASSVTQELHLLACLFSHLGLRSPALLLDNQRRQQ